MSELTPLRGAVFDALHDWVSVTRQQAPMLNDVADGIQLNLQQLTQQFARAASAAETLPVVGLYGHGAQGKAHLRRLLLRHVSGQPDGVDFLARADEETRPLQTIVRVGPRNWPAHDGYPLCLTLLNEGELAQLFLHHFLARGGTLAFDEKEMHRRLTDTHHACEGAETAGADAGQIALLASAYSRLAGKGKPASETQIWYQMSERLPQLSVAQRARCLALLWNDNPVLTERWLTLALTLQQLGNVRRVLAGESLVFDRFRQPVSDFLAPDDRATDDATVVNVCPLEMGGASGPRPVSRSALSMLCAELCADAHVHAEITPLYILDIPGYCHDDGRDMRLSKRNFLSEFARQNAQPDVLIICQSVRQRKENRDVALRLLDWMPADADSPRVVWAITPFDARFHGAANAEDADSAVQRLLNSVQYPWGVCQAMSDNDAGRFATWLNAALSESRRCQFAQRQQAQIKAQVHELFHRWLSPASVQDSTGRQELEAMLRTLQQHAAEHGTLLNALMPPRSALYPLWQHSTPLPRASVGPFDASVDLFAGTGCSAPVPDAVNTDFEHAVHRLWVNHLRQWAQNDGDGLCLSVPQRRTLCEVLITTSYRLDLPTMFSQTLANSERGARIDSVRLMSVLSDFMTWLGYAGLDAASRPDSRWNPGQPIFSSGPRLRGGERLTKLEATPVHAATHYVYDWLIALWTRAVENIGYRHPLDAGPEACQKLTALFNAL